MYQKNMAAQILESNQIKYFENFLEPTVNV